MKSMHFYYKSEDKVTNIHAIEWVPDGEVKAILQIAHGMVEFIDRYKEFAEFLNDRGILVVGNDHLGHGKSVKSKDYYGYFAGEHGNRAVIRDIHKLRIIASKGYENVPYFIMGHSMGSFLVRQYICIHGKGLAGAIIMGTGWHSALETWLGMRLTSAIAAKKGWDYVSDFVDRLAFGGYNASFGDGDGKDWLSANRENVQWCSSEPMCNFKFTVNGYYNMFYGINMLSHKKYLQKMPKDLPVAFVAGDDDPVGNFGVGVLKVYEQFRSLGMSDVSCKLYPGDRHEILNEDDRYDVFNYIYQWICEKINERE